MGQKYRPNTTASSDSRSENKNSSKMMTKKICNIESKNNDSSSNTWRILSSMYKNAREKTRSKSKGSKSRRRWNKRSISCSSLLTTSNNTSMRKNELGHVGPAAAEKEAESVASSYDDDEDDKERHRQDEEEQRRHNNHQRFRLLLQQQLQRQHSTKSSILATSHHSMSCLSTSHHSVVSFGKCETRTYNQVIGDHPCCLEGCPVQLGWEYIDEPSIDVDDYESMKENSAEFHNFQVDDDDDHDDKHEQQKQQQEDCRDDGVDDPIAHSIPAISFTPAASSRSPTPATSSSSSSSPYSLRLSPEERKDILIKQMIIKRRNDSDSIMDVNKSSNNGGDGGESRGSSRRRNSHDCSSGPTTILSSSPSCAASSSYNTNNGNRRRNSDIGPISFTSERELYRECRRLNRYKNTSSWCGGVNTSLYNSHIRNKQQKLFLPVVPP